MRSPLADLARPGRDLAGLVPNRASSVIGARRRLWGTKLNTAMEHGQLKHQNLSYFTETLGIVVGNG